MPPAATEAPANGAAQATILLVDDEPAILRALRRALACPEYRLLLAESGEAALALVEREDVDVVISDMRMPGMDGAALLEAVKERRPGAIRIVLTGYADLKSALAAINRAEIYRFLSKPWNDDDLALTVKKALEYRRAQRELRLLGRIFAVSAEGMAVLDTQHRILRINDAWARIGGYAETEALGQTLTCADDPQLETALWAAVDQNGHWQGEVRKRRPSGELSAHWLTLFRVGDENGRTAHYVALISDVSERVQRESRLAELAFHDALTGLPNRALLMDRIALALAQAARDRHPVALLFFDLDGFKAVNDSLGHAAGDLLLQGVAGRLQACARKSDTVARLGGDEFVLVIGGLRQLERAEEVAREALAALQLPFDLAGTEAYIGASIGIAAFPDHGREPAALLAQADAAMYAAKQAGKNCVRWATADPAPAALPPASSGPARP